MKDTEYASLSHDSIVGFTEVKYIQKVPTFGLSKFPQLIL